MQRLFAVALVAAVLPVSAAHADWWSDAKLVQRGIARAAKTQWITQDDAAAYRAILSRSTGVWLKLPGSRGSNLAAVLHDVARQWQSYIAPRALALFGMLDTNTRYLGSDGMPRDGADILDADGVVYRAFAGHGLQFHPLGNFARLEPAARVRQGHRRGLSRRRADRARRPAGRLADMGVLLPLRRRLPAVDVGDGAGGRGAGRLQPTATTTSPARRTSRSRATSSPSAAGPGSGCTASAT